MARLSGLRTEFINRINSTGVLDLNQLNANNVETVVTGEHPEIDWENLILIKNNWQSGRNTDTIVWTDTGGFFRTKLSSRQVVNLRANTGVISWVDMKAYKRHIGLVHGRTPYVMGQLQLVPLGVRESSRSNWINGRLVRTVNQDKKDKRCRIQLENTIVLLANDTYSRLDINLQNARLIFERQQQHLDLIREHHNVKSYGRLEHLLQEFHEFIKVRDSLIIMDAAKSYGLEIEEADALRVAKKSRQGERIDPFE